jgi:DNA-binding beta-propeller fold protein YncE
MDALNYDTIIIIGFISVDWLDNKIYIVEQNSEMISVYDPVGDTVTVLIRGAHVPHGLVVDPHARYFFTNSPGAHEN